MPTRGRIVLLALGLLTACARDSEVLAPPELRTADVSDASPQPVLQLLVVDPKEPDDLFLRWKGDANGPFPDSPEQSRYPTLGFGRAYALAWQVDVVDGLTLGPLYRASQINPRAYLPVAAALGELATFRLPNDTPPELLPPAGCDGGPDCPELRRWESGRYEFELLALDALGRVRQLDEGLFSFDANYPPESSIVEDPSHPRYGIDDGSGGWIETSFAAGDTVPDGAYVLFEMAGYDRFASSVSNPDSFCCDQRVDPLAPEVLFQGRVRLHGSEGFQFETLYSVAAIPDTIGFLTGPFDYTFWARTKDEHGRVDESPAELAFVAGFPPHIQVVEPASDDTMIVRNPLAGVPWPENQIPYTVPIVPVTRYWDGERFLENDTGGLFALSGHLVPLVLRFFGSTDPRETLQAIRAWAYSLAGENDPGNLLLNNPTESSDLSFFNTAPTPNTWEATVEIFVPSLLWLLPELFEPGGANTTFVEVGAHLRRWLGSHTLEVVARTTKPGDSYTIGAYVRPSTFPVDIDIERRGRTSPVYTTQFSIYLGLDPTDTGSIQRLWPDEEDQP